MRKYRRSVNVGSLLHAGSAVNNCRTVSDGESQPSEVSYLSRERKRIWAKFLAT